MLNINKIISKVENSANPNQSLSNSPGDIGDGPRPVELAGNDVVHGATSVADTEAPRLDAANRRRTLKK
jgi:hypothetical protein